MVASKSILVIEDEPDLRITLEYFLHKIGYEVIAADNGEKGLELCRASQPRVVLCDVMLPGMLGYDVCKEIKASPDTCHVPVIFVSSRDERELISEGRQAGGDFYVCKPVDPQDLGADLYFLFDRNFEMDPTTLGRLRVCKQISIKKAEAAPAAAKRCAPNHDPDPFSDDAEIESFSPPDSNQARPSAPRSRSLEVTATFQQIYKMLLSVQEAISTDCQSGQNPEEVLTTTQKRLDAILQYIEDQ